MFYFEVEYDDGDFQKERGLVSMEGSYEEAVNKLVKEYGVENIHSLTLKPIAGTNNGMLIFSDCATFDPDADVMIV